MVKEFKKDAPMIHFSLASSTQSQEIANLVNSAYRGAQSKQGWTTEADLLGGQRTDENSVNEMFCLNDSHIVLARDDRSFLLGCAHLQKEVNGDCYLGMLTVTSSRQNLGLGKSIINHAEILARSWGCIRIRMTVISRRIELISFYLRRGYVCTGIRTPFPSTEPRFGKPKVENLEFEEMVKLL